MINQPLYAYFMYAMLCVHGHPVHRSPDVTYGGLSPRIGYQRDHVVPLCLGGKDEPANMQYQPLDEALRKDKVERYACEAYCARDLDLDQARRVVEEWSK